MIRALIVEDDDDIRGALHALLEDVGYEVNSASSLAEALAQIDQDTFQIILADSFAGSAQNVLPTLQLMLRRAKPTPIGIVTAWNLDEQEAQQAGFAFIAPKPFDIDQLLTKVAATLSIPLTPEEERQALVVRRYFAALTARDWDALMDTCVDDVTYILPGATPFSGTFTGKAAFRAYTEETFSQFPEARFDNVSVYASPTGLASRYRGKWRLPDGSTPILSGAVHFQFDGERIKQIGVFLNDERFRALLEPTQSSSEASTPSSAS